MYNSILYLNAGWNLKWCPGKHNTAKDRFNVPTESILFIFHRPSVSAPHDPEKIQRGEDVSAL